MAVLVNFSNKKVDWGRHNLTEACSESSISCSISGLSAARTGPLVASSGVPRGDGGSALALMTLGNNRKRYLTL